MPTVATGPKLRRSIWFSFRNAAMSRRCVSSLKREPRPGLLEDPHLLGEPAPRPRVHLLVELGTELAARAFVFDDDDADGAGDFESQPGGAAGEVRDAVECPGGLAGAAGSVGEDRATGGDGGVVLRAEEWFGGFFGDGGEVAEEGELERGLLPGFVVLVARLIVRSAVRVVGGRRLAGSRAWRVAML
jgi:hypothetical protein